MVANETDVANAFEAIGNILNALNSNYRKTNLLVGVVALVNDEQAAERGVLPAWRAASMRGGVLGITVSYSVKTWAKTDAAILHCQ